MDNVQELLSKDEQCSMFNVHELLSEGEKCSMKIALLPDHPTPCKLRTHTAEPIPFVIWYPGIQPDSVQTFDEVAAREGAYGTIEGDAFINLFMSEKTSS